MSTNPVMDDIIMNRLIKHLSDNVAPTFKSVPNQKSNSPTTYLLVARSGLVTVAQFQYMLQLRFDSVSDNFATAHENANKIVDETARWCSEVEDLNIMGYGPDLNGVVDDSDKAGTYDSIVTLQIRYMA